MGREAGGGGTGDRRQAILFLIREGFGVSYPGLGRNIRPWLNGKYLVEDLESPDGETYRDPDRAVDQFLLP